MDTKVWVGAFSAARAHRLPPGVQWQEVLSRVTEDSSTGEVIEKTRLDDAPFAPAAATRRLDRDRDIVTRVELRAELMTETPPLKMLAKRDRCMTETPPTAKRLVWADAEYEDG